MNFLLPIKVQRFFIFSVLIQVGGCNYFNTSSESSMAKAALSVPVKDSVLFVNAYQNILAGIKISQEGLTRSTSAEAMTLAATINKDHKTTLALLTDLSTKNSIIVPFDITQEQLADWKMLVKKRGRDFDKTFAEIILKYHAEASLIFSSLANSTNGDIQKFSRQMTATVKSHTELASAAQRVIAQFLSRDTTVYIPTNQK